jgi:hypothetical protein
VSRGAAGTPVVERVNCIDLSSGHELQVTSQVTLLNRNHLSAAVFSALAFAFYVDRVFVGLTAAVLPRFDLGVGAGYAGNRQQAGN